MSLLSDGSHLVFGGYGLPSTTSEPGSLTHSRLSHPILLLPTRNDCLQFDIVTVPLTPCTPCARIYHVSLTIQRNAAESVIVFGGRTSPRAPLDDLHILDVKTRTWSPVTRNSGVSWPEARCRHAAVLLNINNDRQICLIHGGLGADGRILSDAWFFDPNSSVWTRASFLDHVIGPRHSHQMYYESSTLHVFGGVATTVAGPNSTRIAPNVKIGLRVEKDGNLSDDITSQSIPLYNQSSSLNRYSHRITPWNPKASILLMSGGLTDSGIIPPHEQCYLINTNTGEVVSLDLSESEPRCLVDHTCSLIKTFNGEKVAMIVGGGITCFSFGSRFDVNPILLSDSALIPSEIEYDNKKNNDIDRFTTFISNPEDTWNQLRDLPRFEGSIEINWKESLTRSEPAVFSKLNLGNCLKNWTPLYLKEKSGKLKCSVHISNKNSSNFLTWHDKNFKYLIMTFEELIDLTLIDSSSSSKNLDTTVYLRSLSNSPKKPSDLSKDFPELSNDFILPEPLRQTVMKDFFSSVLRISGADMGLWAHYDTCDNILAQVKGRKLVRMWHPSEAPNLYLEGSSSHIPNFETPDLDRFPLYRKSHPMVTTLEPGDVLFIPATWLHSVQSLEPSISINIFFRTQPNHLYPSHDIWGNLDFLPAQVVEKEVLEAVKGLDELPLAQCQLYLKKIGMNLIRLADQKKFM